MTTDETIKALRYAADYIEESRKQLLDYEAKSSHHRSEITQAVQLLDESRSFEGNGKVWEATQILKKLVALVALAAICFGCANTVTPKIVQSSQASWDSGEQTSGIIRVETIGTTKFFHVTPHFRDRYNALVDIYGFRFQPPLTHDKGISPYFFDPPPGQDYTIDAEHMADFLRMNRWKKQGE